MSVPTFEIYLNTYEKTPSIFLHELVKTDLPKLEWASIRLMYYLEYNLLEIKEDSGYDFLRHTLVRIINECFGVIGTLKQGAFHSSFHHTRAIWEFFAALAHVFDKTKNRERKLEKFKEYHSVAKYLHYDSCKKDLDNGIINEKEFNYRCKVSKEDFELLKQKVDDWKRIWKLKNDPIEIITHWHHPCDIKGLFMSSSISEDSWDTYGLFCHTTHLSPLGSRAANGLFMIGFPRKEDGNFDLRLLNRPISGAILGLQKTLLFLAQTDRIKLLQDIVEIQADFS